MSFRKGSSPHRAAGNVFFISMLSLSASGAYLALMKHQMNNVFGGVLTFYMVATAWVTVRRKDKDGQTGIFDWGALLVALAVGIVIVTYGLEKAYSQTAPKDGGSRRYELFHGFRGSACCRGGHSHAHARRYFWRTTYRAASLAHVLWAVYRLRVLLPGTAASIPSLVTQNKRAFYPGYLATDIADFLAVPSSLHQRIQEKIHVARRCLLLTDLAFELTSQQDTGGRQ